MMNDAILDGIVAPAATCFHASNSTSKVRNESFFYNFNRSQEIIKARLDIQGLVMEHSFNNLEFYTNIIEEYETRTNTVNNNAEIAENKELSQESEDKNV